MKLEKLVMDYLEEARGLFMAKYPAAEKISLEQLQDPNFIAAFYKKDSHKNPSISENSVVFDEINFPKDPRQELRL